MDARGALHEGLIEGLGRGVAELAGAVDPDRTVTAEQAAIVEAGLGPALVVAGAGSGKTETLSLRILYLLDNAKRLFGRDIGPDEILCLTFTRKAAAEIAERATRRIGTVFGPDPARPAVSVSTYNGYAAALAQEHGLRVAVDPGATVLTGAALWQLAQSVVESWDRSVDTDAAVSTVTAAIPRLASQARDHGLSPERLREWCAKALDFMEALPKRATEGTPGTFTQDLARHVGKVRSLAALADLVDEYDARKREGSFLDFSDQVDVAVRLAQLAPVQELERSRYVAVLLDEFQDTSPPQLDLFARMFGPTHPVMAVGDPNQAIYGFRGASADALRQFIERFGGSAVARHTLSVSWRNEATILQAANAAVAPLAAGPVAGVPLRSRAEELGREESPRAAPGVIATRHVTADDEARAVVGFIRARREELGHSAATPITAAVLCRRRAQYDAITDACAAAGLDYEVVGLGGLLDVPDVADLLALLHVAHDPSRGDSLMRLLAGERVALGPRDLAALHDHAEHLAGPRAEREGSASIVDALASLPPADWVSERGRSLTSVGLARLRALAHVIDAIRRHTYLPLAELVAFAERSWGLDIETGVASHATRARRSVDAFIDAARTFQAGAERATLGAFLAWLEAARAEENGLDAPVREPDPAAVQILTVHGAKGLEWDVVAVPGLNDGQFPSVGVPSASNPDYTDSGWLDGVGNVPFELRLDRDQLPQWRFHSARDHQELAESLADFKREAGQYRLEEERRLFYVALTRARSHVLLSGSWYSGGKRPRDPSGYVMELLKDARADAGQWEDLPADDEAPDPVERPPALWPRPVTRRQAALRELAAAVRSSMAPLGESGPPSTAPMAAIGDQGLPLSREISAMLAERADRGRGSDQIELPWHVSTSALVAMSRDRAAFAAQLRRPIPVEPTRAAQQGSALHAWIEARYGHVPLWEDEDSDDAAAAELDALKETFLASEWASRTPTHVEADVELPVGNVTVRSRIDAVFAPGAGLDRVTVVDWKSGRPPRDDSERSAREVQLAMYRLAWSARTGIPVEQIDAAFYYVAADLTVRPEHLWGRKEIEELLAGSARNSS
ncbi:ATP-dependent helicase [Demequina sp. TTPB684]|uniref:ATP-dependent DNA helicase n=1 Tax=unclassified Demequina TaxID=2620311 RepID=UPI001CF4043A|nr:MULTISPECIES: ATP-dependent DNA helicase [unclassified Demequina]MCB2412064.1 ATP-dependent helicase [Demequina sp. TTPB684]UPU89787.1 ATP-dependent helicase [Demequina sp. TMPB413]